MTDYRGTPAKCPACGTMMEERGAQDVMVDVCPNCRGLWIDWFDGDTVEVASKAAPLSVRAPVAIDLSKAFCPRCQRPLNFTNHVVHEHASGNLANVGPVLLRCGECGGTFVPRTVFDEMLELANHPDEETIPDSPLGKLLAALRRIFAASPT
jgi:ssDNA-binding Zn-finger/Zn-ribbon topoisomerase 1